MRHPLHILLNVVTLLSLVLSLAMVWLWVRSYGPRDSAGDADAFDFTHRDPYYWVISNPGRLTFCHQVGRDWSSPRSRFNVLGLEWAASDGNGDSLSNLLIPYWMLASAALVLPVARLGGWGRRRRRATRRLAGLCSVCGYDLRATPERCPECGAVAEHGVTVES